MSQVVKADDRDSTGDHSVVRRRPSVTSCRFRNGVPCVSRRMARHTKKQPRQCSRGIGTADASDSEPAHAAADSHYPVRKQLISMTIPSRLPQPTAEESDDRQCVKRSLRITIRNAYCSKSKTSTPASPPPADGKSSRASTSPSTPARSTPSWARTAPARARWRRSWPAATPTR